MTLSIVIYFNSGLTGDAETFCSKEKKCSQFYCWTNSSSERFSRKVKFLIEKTSWETFAQIGKTTQLSVCETQIAIIIGKLLLKIRIEIISSFFPIGEDDQLCSLGLVKIKTGTQAKKTRIKTAAFRYFLPVSLSKTKLHKISKGIS